MCCPRHEFLVQRHLPQQYPYNKHNMLPHYTNGNFGHGGIWGMLLVIILCLGFASFALDY